MVEEKEESDDLIRLSSGPIAPYDVAFDMSKEHPKQLVEIDGREVEFDEEEQQYVFADENGGENQ